MSPDWQGLSNLWVVFAVVTATVTDLRWGKIYNVVTLPALAAGLALNSLATGWAGLFLSLQGLAFGLALLLTTLLFGQYMGGGDVKLLAALGALRGPGFLLATLAVAIPLGGVMALGLALSRGVLKDSLGRLGWSLYGRFVLGTSDSPDAGASLKLPYALAIAGGAFATLWWHP